MSNLIIWINDNQGVVAVVLAIITAIAGLIWNYLKKDQTAKFNKSNYISAGGNISAGGDIVVGNKIINKKSGGLIVELAQPEISWDKYAIGRWVWPSFRVVLRINNYNNESPEYIKVYLRAKSTDGVWEAVNYIFQNKLNEDKSDPNHEYRIEGTHKEDVSVFVSPYNIEHGDKEKFPDIDRDTLKLIVTTESKKTFVIPIRPGWIQG